MVLLFPRLAWFSSIFNISDVKIMNTKPIYALMLLWIYSKHFLIPAIDTGRNWKTQDNKMK